MGLKGSKNACPLNYCVFYVRLRVWITIHRFSNQSHVAMGKVKSVFGRLTEYKEAEF